MWGKMRKKVRGEIWGSMLECGRSEVRCRGYGIFYPFSPPPSTFSSPPPHLPFPPPHFSTPQHISPHLLPHFLTPSVFPPYLYQLPKLLKISLFLLHPYSSKLPQILCTSSFYPILHPPVLPIVTLSFTSHQNFSLFLIYCQINSATKYTRNSLEFHKKKFKNKNKKWQHSV